MRRIVFPLILGVVGVAILLSLGFWQLRRLEWKQAMLAEITARDRRRTAGAARAGATEALKYAPVSVAGRTTGQEVLVLTGMKDVGAGYEVISAFETAGRAAHPDRPRLCARNRAPRARPAVALQLTGNLHWPHEADSYTPAPDLAAGVWFARDLPAMAAASWHRAAAGGRRAGRGRRAGHHPGSDRH